MELCIAHIRKQVGISSMTSIQGYSSLANSYQTTAKANASNSSVSTSDSESYNLNDMSLGQIRTISDQMAVDGKLDPMQWATLQISGWMDKDPYNPTPLDAQNGGQTYDVVSTLQNAAAFETTYGNTEGATEYENLLNTFETFDSQQ
jgi:hypothetical protein